MRKTFPHRLDCTFRFLILILLVGLPLAGSAEPLPAEFMTVGQLRPGMVGEGRTVVNGYKVEPFEVEILGVDFKAMAGQDMILARVDAPWLERHGIPQGVSGSPVYVDGKIIGAIAYGYPFAYQPYCGITPIENMWNVWESIGKPGLRETDSRRRGIATSDGAWDWQAAWEAYSAKVEGRAPASEAAAVYRPSLPALAGLEGGMRPLYSPMYVSGASPWAEQKLKTFFAGYGVDLINLGTGGGGGESGEPAPPIENGSSLGVPVVTGDMVLNGIGTVTYRKGDRLIGFGHPMFFSGGTSAPMSTARIYGIMQSYYNSFKMGVVGDVIGTIDQDRKSGIGGIFNAGPPRVPVTVHVDGPAASHPATYHFSIWKHPDLLPVFSLVVASEGYSSSVASGGAQTARLAFEITLGDGQKIRYSTLSSSEEAAFGPLGREMLLDLFLLLNNPYYEADISSIDIKATVDAGLQEVTLVDLRPEYSIYQPGDTVRLTARLRPWRGAEYERPFEVKLPAGLDPGSYVIHLTDSEGTERIEQANRPGLYSPRSYPAIVQMLQSRDLADNRLQLSLFQASTGIDLKGTALRGLPTSVEGMIASSAPGDWQARSVGQLIGRQVFDLPTPVGGSQSLAVQVVDHINR